MDNLGEVASRLAARYQQLPETQQEMILALLPKEHLLALRFSWELWAHEYQLPPQRPWSTWEIIGNRGAGKTRAGAEWVRSQVEQGNCRSLALVAATADTARYNMVEGASGILACSPPWFMPEYQPTRRRLVWPNGATATLYSAEAPEYLRGPAHDGAWADEVAPGAAHDLLSQIVLSLRLGNEPRMVITGQRPVPSLPLAIGSRPGYVGSIARPGLGKRPPAHPVLSMFLRRYTEARQ